MRALIARFASVVLLVSSLGSVARADTTDDCVAANARAQALRKADKLRDAHDELVRCSAEACPKMVRDDCAARLDEVDRAIPTVVFLAKDASGRDVTHVSVSMDGASLGELAGRALEVTVGEHEFSFSASGYKALAQRFVIVEGQKGRLETVTLESAAPIAQPRVVRPLVVAQPNEQADRSKRKTLRVVGFTIGALGLGGLIVAIPFAVLGGNQNGVLQAGGFATSDEIAAANSTGNAYNAGLAASLIGGVVFLGIGAVLVLANLEVRASPSGVALRW